MDVVRGGLYRAPKQISVRSCNAIASEVIQRYRLSFPEMVRHCRHLRRLGFSEEDFLLDESAPDHRVTLQAEVMNSDRFLEMRYALHSGVGMRQAYGRMKHVHGAVVPVILKTYLDANSWDNLQEILATYRDSVVELSAYDVSVGQLGWNSICWECRNF